MALIGTEAVGATPWPPRVTPQEGGPMQKYDVEVNGMATTLLLSDEDAKARGLTPAKKAEVETKQRTPQNKAAIPKQAGR